MTNIDFASLPDAEIARWMAERDGWRVEKAGNRWLLSRPGADDWFYGTRIESDIANYFLTNYGTNYPHSLDAAVAWLGRRGLEWTRQVNLEAVHVSNGISWHTCAEDRFTTARALCNAGVAAEMAREAQE